jgi:hypothetical protein
LILRQRFLVHAGEPQHVGEHLPDRQINFSLADLRLSIRERMQQILRALEIIIGKVGPRLNLIQKPRLRRSGLGERLPV